MNTSRHDGWVRLRQFDEIDPAAPLVELPEDLTTIAQGELDELLASLIDRFDEVRDSDIDADALALLQQLAAGITALRAEGDRRTALAAEAAAEVDRLASEVHPAEAAEGEEPDPPLATDAPPTADDDDETLVPELVPASAAPSGGAPAMVRLPLGTVARHAPTPRLARGDGLNVNIVAAADVPGLSTGARITDMTRLAEGVHDRVRMMDDHQKASVARVHYPIPEGDTILPGQDPLPILDRVRHFPGIDALAASGGWCGPLEPLYTLCRIDAASGMLTLPTVRIARSGIQVPSPITMPADLSTVGFKWCHDDDVAAAPPNSTNKFKPCIRIPCPTWTPYELCAYGICVTHGNLADRSFPELTREYIGMLMNAHMHAMNAGWIATVEAGSTAVDGPEVGSAASSILGAAELAGEFYREKYHMDDGAILDIVLPTWVCEVMRADLSARAGVDLLNVSDAIIGGYFVARGLRPQFVQDWQPLANATAYPTSLKMLIYPPGTWVLGSGGTLDLGVTRDSVLNATNDFTAMFTEDFWLIAKVCTESLVVTSTLAVDGVTACCTVGP